jgi:hypothetical protein
MRSATKRLVHSTCIRRKTTVDSSSFGGKCREINRQESGFTCGAKRYTVQRDRDSPGIILRLCHPRSRKTTPSDSIKSVGLRRALTYAEVAVASDNVHHCVKIYTEIGCATGALIASPPPPPLLLPNNR